MALLEGNKRVVKAAQRIMRRACVADVVARMPTIAYTVRSVDKLATRAMWRRQGLPLKMRASYVGGVRRGFLAP